MVAREGLGTIRAPALLGGGDNDCVYNPPFVVQPIMGLTCRDPSGAISLCVVSDLLRLRTQIKQGEAEAALFK